MDKVSYVTCPGCSRDFYVERSEYAGHPEAPCQCPFCLREFTAGEGNPRPPLTVNQ
jgi:hypothetical protein